MCLWHWWSEWSVSGSGKLERLCSACGVYQYRAERRRFDFAKSILKDRLDTTENYLAKARQRSDELEAKLAGRMRKAKP